jgi:competence protein ComEC
MAGVVLSADFLGRPVSAVRVLGLTVTGLLVVDPALAWSLGFGLSVGACLGIALFAVPLTRVVPGPPWLAAPLATTLAAQLGTAPLLVGGLGGVPVVAPLANLLALPAAEPVTVWGLVAGLPAGLVGGPAATVLHLPTGLLVSWVATVARFAGGLPLGVLGAGEAAVAGLALGGLVATRSGPGRAWAQRGCAVAVVGACAVPAWRTTMPTARWAAPVAPGARLWVEAGGPRPGASVLVLERVDAEGLLAGLRRRGVRAVSVVVVGRTSRALARDVAALLPRLRARAVVAPDRRLVGLAASPVVVADGPVSLRAGGLLVRVTPGRLGPAGALSTEVSRAPP